MDHDGLKRIRTARKALDADIGRVGKTSRLNSELYVSWQAFLTPAKKWVKRDSTTRWARLVLH
jgi:hypothetical protein